MRLVFGVCSLLWTAYLGMAAFWQPGWMPDISLFRRITTYECPLDGLTRSIYAAAHGEFTSAFEFNPLFPVYVGIIVFLIYLSARFASGKSETPNPKPILILVGVTMLLTIVIRVLAA